jgi:hypothetical protein
MRKLESLALVLIILMILTNFVSLFGGGLIARIYGPEYAAINSANVRLVTSARSFLSMIVNLAIGIWLFIQAKENNNRPWIWLLFGMIYGLIAPVLFFILTAHESEDSAC